MWNSDSCVLLEAFKKITINKRETERKQNCWKTSNFARKWKYLEMLSRRM